MRSPTGRRPSGPEFQDPNWGRRGRDVQPASDKTDLDWSALERRVARHMEQGRLQQSQIGEGPRASLSQMCYQIRAAEAGMQRILQDLPPGAVLHGDELDLTGVAPKDLREYVARVSDWLESHSKRMASK